MEHRDQWERLCADRSLAASATEELLRYDAPTQFFPKRAAADEELLGVRIPAGTTIHVGNAAANRDPLAFEEPELWTSRGGRTTICRSARARTSALAHQWRAWKAGSSSRRWRAGSRTSSSPSLPADLDWKRHVVLRGLRSLPVHPGHDRG